MLKFERILATLVVSTLTVIVIFIVFRMTSLLFADINAALNTTTP